MKTYMQVFTAALFVIARNQRPPKGFPVGAVLKNPPASVGDVGSISGSGRSPGEGNGNPLQYSCLENSMDRGALQATVHGGRKESDTTEQLHSLNCKGALYHPLLSLAILRMKNTRNFISFLSVFLSTLWSAFPSTLSHNHHHFLSRIQLDVVSPEFIIYVFYLHTVFCLTDQLY